MVSSVEGSKACTVGQQILCWVSSSPSPLAPKTEIASCTQVIFGRWSWEESSKLRITLSWVTDFIEIPLAAPSMGCLAPVIVYSQPEMKGWCPQRCHSGGVCECPLQKHSVLMGLGSCTLWASYGSKNRVSVIRCSAWGGCVKNPSRQLGFNNLKSSNRPVGADISAV